MIDQIKTNQTKIYITPGKPRHFPGKNGRKMCPLNGLSTIRYMEILQLSSSIEKIKISRNVDPNTFQIQSFAVHFLTLSSMFHPENFHRKKRSLNG